MNNREAGEPKLANSQVEDASLTLHEMGYSPSGKVVNEIHRQPWTCGQILTLKFPPICSSSSMDAYRVWYDTVPEKTARLCQTCGRLEFE